jgi:uncharacterized RDD family membrane protein YckC
MTKLKHLPPASKTTRFLSLGLDIIIYLVLAFGFMTFFSNGTVEHEDELLEIFRSIYMVIFSLFYFSQKKSPGNALTGLSIVDEEGKSPSFFQLTLRAACAGTFLAFLTILFSSENRGFHDFIGKTYVVKKSA